MKDADGGKGDIVEGHGDKPKELLADIEYRKLAEDV